MRIYSLNVNWVQSGNGNLARHRHNTQTIFRSISYSHLVGKPINCSTCSFFLSDVAPPITGTRSSLMAWLPESSYRGIRPSMRYEDNTVVDNRNTRPDRNLIWLNTEGQCPMRSKAKTSSLQAVNQAD